MDRSGFLNTLIGKPWQANGRGPDAWDCFHLMNHIQNALAGRVVADIDLPAAPSWKWMIDAVEGHPDRPGWRLVPNDALGVVTASDLAVVLMARRQSPAHVGVWLKAEGGIIHADQDCGVSFETVAELHTKGWTKLRFYEPL